MQNNNIEFSAALSDAFKFSEKKHHNQVRKNAEKDSYIVHPVNVALLLWGVGMITDKETIIAALLHDTIEDTSTKDDEISDQFGIAVLKIVKEVTDDKNMPKHDRKQHQIEHAPSLSLQAKLVKLADKISNVTDVINNPPPDWDFETRREYIIWAEKVVAGLRGVNPALENKFDELITIGKQKFQITGQE